MARSTTGVLNNGSSLNGDTMKSLLLPLCTLFAVSLLVCACDAHDYWALSHTIVVDSEQDILSAQNDSSFSQDLFVRYQLDYEIQNLSASQASEVVVSATSYVNAVERATGSRVWHLDPDETAQGILTTSQLQLGNSLVITLSSCATSRCSRKEVLCPETTDSRPEVSEIATFCYDACKDTQTCIATCPAESSCTEYCKDSADVDDCRTQNCDDGGSVSTCAHVCRDEVECDCTATEECIGTCQSKSATCYRNCLATWTQCTDEVSEIQTDKIPCALCDGVGLCHTDFDTTEEEIHTLTSESGETYVCDLNCRVYPAACVTGCEELYADDSSRHTCLDGCLRQFMFWCNDYSIPVDYVDSSGKQPCCFESFCHAELSGVVKTYDVACFNDTDCGSGSSCSDEGLCVASGSSNCAATPRSKSPHSLFWLLPILCFILRKKEARCSPK